MLVVAFINDEAAAVVNGYVEAIQGAWADDEEPVVLVLVGRDNIGTIETEGVHLNPECGVDIAAHGVETAQGDPVGAGGVDVEMVRDRLAGAGTSIAKEPLGVVAVLRVVGKVNYGYFGVNVMGTILEVEGGNGDFLHKKVDGGNVATVGSIANEVVAGVLGGRNGDGLVMFLSVERGVGWDGIPQIVLGTTARQGAGAVGTDAAVGGVGCNLGGEQVHVHAVPNLAAR